MGAPVHYHFASSPRHLLLLAGLALEARDAEHHLFFIEHIPAAGVARYLRMLESWPSSPFASVQALEGDWRPELGSLAPAERRKRKPALKRAFRARNRARLDAALERAAPDAIFAGIDNYYEVQYALHRATRLRPGLRRVYVEDGSSAYEYSFRNLHLRELPKELLRTLRYGLWWRPCTLAGTSGWLTEAYVAFPELVHERLRGLELHELPREVFLGEDFRQLAAVMAAELGVDCEGLSGADVLIAVTNSKWASLLPGYRDTMVGIVEALLAAGRRVALKLHPREQDPDPLGLGRRGDLYEVPQQAMFELLAILVRNPELVVIGDASTALIGVQWLRPELETIALQHDRDATGGTFLERIFEEIGVTLEREPARFVERRFGAAEPVA